MSNKIVDISGLERFFDNIKNYISGILSNKVDKVQGKDLSTEDFTTELKSKLSQVNILAEDVNEELDDVETNTYVKYVAQTLTEQQKSQVRSNIGVNLSGYAKTEDLTDYAKTADLSGYAKKSNLSNVATSGSYNDLTNKPTILSESDVNNLIDTKIGDINSVLENIINGN
jgi:hypothetical protein